MSIRYFSNSLIMRILLKRLGVLGERRRPRTLGGGVGCTSQSGQPAIEATACIFGSAKRLLQRSKIEGD